VAQAWLVQIDAANPRLAQLGGLGEPVQDLVVIDEADVDAVESGGEAIEDGGEPAGNLGELLQHAAAAQLVGVVDGGLQAEDVLAFGIGLELQAPEVELEPGQAILRSLDHNLLCGRATGTITMGARLGAEESPHDRNVEAGAGAIDHAREDGLHLCPNSELEIAAVLDLVDRVAVCEAAAGLLV